jgi:hypothetical protein
MRPQIQHHHPHLLLLQPSKSKIAKEIQSCNFMFAKPVLILASPGVILAFGIFNFIGALCH